MKKLIWLYLLPVLAGCGMAPKVSVDVKEEGLPFAAKWGGVWHKTG